MRQFVIRYQTTPDRTADNREAIRKVFAELGEARPEGCTYTVLELEDGGFIHIVAAPDDPAANPISRLPAFKAFSAGIRERVEAEPVLRNARVVGTYGSFAAEED